MSLPEKYKRFTWGNHKRPLVIHPYQLGRLYDFASSIEEISNLGECDTNPLHFTLSLVSKDFFYILEDIDEEVKGGAK